MDEMTLTEAQESIIIDFIKRWGIDTPELVAELMDHYCELVLEEMATGRNFQNVVNSWKTKKTLQTLRAIEKSYSKRLKKTWNKEQKKAILNVVFGKPVLCLIPLYFLFVLALSHELSSTILSWGFSIKILVSTLGGLYFFSFNTKKSRIYGFKRLSFYVSFNMWMLIYVVPDILETHSLLNHMTSKSPFVLAGIFILIVAVDFVFYRLYTKAKLDSNHLTDEILKEFKLPPRV